MIEASFPILITTSPSHSEVMVIVTVIILNLLISFLSSMQQWFITSPIDDKFTFPFESDRHRSCRSSWSRGRPAEWDWLSSHFLDFFVIAVSSFPLPIIISSSLSMTIVIIFMIVNDNCHLLMHIHQIPRLLLSCFLSRSSLSLSSQCTMRSRKTFCKNLSFLYSPSHVKCIFEFDVETK